MKRFVTIIVFPAVLFCSCKHYYYVANTQNVPLFKEKNEYHISGSVGIGDESACAEVQAAYSVTRNFAFMTNFMTAKGIENSPDSWGKGNYLDGAIGYYKPFGKSGVFEIYGGFGGSNQKHQYRNIIPDPNNPAFSNPNAGTSHLSFTKLFIQPSVGLTLNGFDCAFSTRFCRLSYNLIDNQIDELLNENEFENLNTIIQNKDFLFFEPALTLRGGWKNVKVQLQGATASYLNNNKWFFDEFRISIGLYGAIAKGSLKDVPK